MITRKLNPFIDTAKLLQGKHEYITNIFYFYIVNPLSPVKIMNKMPKKIYWSIYHKLTGQLR